MLKLAKNRTSIVSSAKKTPLRSTLTGVFIVSALIGFGVPLAGFGAGNAASATSPLTSSTAVSSTATNTYAYTRISIREAYPYYITASFMTAAGLALYSLTYVPFRQTARSRYPSRFTTVSRTTY